VKENNFTRAVYYEIIARKTAALFKSAGRIGAKLAHADEAVVEALGQYGYSVGLAFQIIDDVLDLTADSAQLGKTSGIDLAQGRGYVAAYSNNGHSTVGVAEAVAEEADPMMSIKQKILQGDAINEARIQARALAQAAIACLDVLPDSQAKQELIELANMVVDRDH
jgi:geranylgeranyl pyrophosphate synthase